MSSRVIHENRIQRLNDRDVETGEFVLYWMQQSQRSEDNHALEFAIQRANETGKRLLVLFVVTDSYPEANLRHFRFMLEGLRETSAALKRRRIPLAVRFDDLPAAVVKLSKQATEVVCDRGYLRHQVEWRRHVAQNAERRVWQVETDAIVPVESASPKQEYAARTIRPKLTDRFEDYLTELDTTAIDQSSLDVAVNGEDLSDVDRLLESMSIDRNVSSVDEFPGGTSEARKRLKHFLKDSLSHYDARTSVVDSHVSMLSPYLHFGQISPLKIALEVNSSRGHQQSSKEAFIEELLVRRELAVNFVHYQPDYDSLTCLPDWAAETLSQHESDEREHHYTASELEAGETHDPAWNAAMLEMKHRGYLHNHLRMYWGKKIIEWTNTTGHAYRTALQLNNRYFLDGRDANSYANVAWLFGLHDRAHQERPIFGKVRYMSAGGLNRKIDVDGYIQQVAERHSLEIANANPKD